MDTKKIKWYFFNKIKIILKENVLDVSCYSVMSAAFMRIWLIDKNNMLLLLLMWSSSKQFALYIQSNSIYLKKANFIIQA